jgi:hypothetical protein
VHNIFNQYTSHLGLLRLDTYLPAAWCWWWAKIKNLENLEKPKKKEGRKN